MTSPVFHFTGKQPLNNDLLTMSVIGLINMSRQDFSSDVGIGSSLDVVDFVDIIVFFTRS